MYREAIPRRGEAREWQESASTPGTGDRGELEACLEGRGLDGWGAKLPGVGAGRRKVATRVASAEVINAIADVVPGLVAGGADLTGNTGTELKDHGVQSVDEPGGRQVLLRDPRARHGRDHERHGPARRRAPRRRHVLLLQRLHAPGGAPGRLERGARRLRVDARLGRPRRGRAHPPTDRAAGRAAGHARAAGDPPGRRQRDRPGLAHRRRPRRPHRAGPHPPGRAGARGHGRRRRPWPRGAYVLAEADGEPDLVLVGTGSEVPVCVEAAEQLAADGVATRVVSMPSWELFAEQDEAYRESVLPARDADAGRRGGRSVRLGPLGRRRRSASTASAPRRPGQEVLENLGFTPENVAARARSPPRRARSP